MGPRVPGVLHIGMLVRDPNSFVLNILIRGERDFELEIGL